MPDDSLASPRYELKELAARAGVTARTIHFYIQQGLLPPAGQPGPGARYSEAHLARLLLIRRLQREHLPLSAIRQRLGAVDDESLVRLAASTASRPEAASQPTSALDYIRGVLGAASPPASVESAPSRAPLRRRELHDRFADAESTRADARLAAPSGAEVSADARLAALPFAARWGFLRRSPSVASPVAGERSQWERIVLAPDIELHIRRPLTRDQNKRVERLVQAARNILEGEV